MTTLESLATAVASAEEILGGRIEELGLQCRACGLPIVVKAVDLEEGAARLAAHDEVCPRQDLR